MTTTPPHAPDPTLRTVEDNPAKPWKAIAAFLAPAILAFLQAVLENGGEGIPDWLWLILGGLAAAVSVFIVKNPKRRKRQKSPARP